jgi:hypothetical protein
MRIYDSTIGDSHYSMKFHYYEKKENEFITILIMAVYSQNLIEVPASIGAYVIRN